MIHIRNIPGALGSGAQGDFNTGPHRIPITKGHSAKNGRQQVYLIHKNIHRESAKMRIHVQNTRIGENFRKVPK